MAEAPVTMNTEIPPTTPAAPEEVEVTLGNVTVKLPKAAAEALKSEQDAAAAKMSEAQALKEAVEAGKLAEANRGKTPAVNPDDLDYNELFVNPQEFLTKFAKGIEARLTAAYTQTEQQKQFWEQFYSTHGDLKSHDFYVKAVLQREMAAGKYATKTVAEVIDLLGKTTKGELLAMVKAGGGTGLPKPPVAEGGTERLPAGSKPDSESSHSEAPKSLSAILRARREARRVGQKAA